MTVPAHRMAVLAVRANGERPAARELLDALEPTALAAVAERMRQFGQAGHAGDYVPVTLEQMRERYAMASATT